MVEMRENATYQAELPNYEEEEGTAPDHVASKGAADTFKKGYNDIDGSGFKDFLLKPDMLRPGLGHLSEGNEKRAKKEVLFAEAAREEEEPVDPLSELKANARKARINAVWEQLNSNGSSKSPNAIPKSYKATEDKPKPKKCVPDWMVSLGIAPKKPSMVNVNIDGRQAFSDGLASNRQREVGTKSIEASEEAKRIAAAALAAVKDATALNKGGKIEVNEIRNFAGEEVKLRKFVDPNSTEAQIAQERTKMQAASTSSLDALLDQISKKRKLNILDKSKKDWGDYKEKEGLEEELDAYKKSSDKYLDKVSFLQRADLREYEREREIRLAQLSKRRVDSQRD